jgi:hypothetical protein
MVASSRVSAEQQRLALDSILSSKTFDRSEQLRSFLRYVCEQSLLGAASQLTEYSIGVHALGRPENFAPAEDSIVRNRAYALRKKLEEYYEGEGSSEPVRIDLPKGSYSPQFSLIAVAAAERPAPAVVVMTDPPLPPPGSTRWPILVAFAAGTLIGALCLLWWQRDRIIPTPPRMVKALWGSFLEPGVEVLLCVSTPPSVFLRAYPVENPPVPGVYPLDENLKQWWRLRRSDGQAGVLYAVPNFNSPLWGDSAGATHIARMLASHGVKTELVAERLIKLPALRNRNVVFLGSPEYSTGVSQLLRGLPFQVQYDETAKDHLAVEVDTTGAVLRRFAVERSPEVLTVVYGLLTFLPAEGDGRLNRRYLVVSGISSAGTLGAAEYAASEPHVAGLLEKTGGKTGGQRGILQVLVRVKAYQTLPMHFEYEAHRLL